MCFNIDVQNSSENLIDPVYLRVTGRQIETFVPVVYHTFDSHRISKGSMCVPKAHHSFYFVIMSEVLIQ